MRRKSHNQTRRHQFRVSHQTAAGNTVVRATAGTLAAIQNKAKKVKAPYVIEQLHLGEIDTDEYLARGAARPHWYTIYTAQPERRGGRLPNPATGKWQVEGVFGHPGGAHLSKEKAIAAAKKIANAIKSDVSVFSPAGAEISVSPSRKAPRTPNPATGSTRPLVTDRALRYRAQRNPPPGPELCAYCGAAGPLDIEHIDGHEENTAPENLLYACRPCNTIKGIAFREDGIGRPTRQYNPEPAAIREQLNRLYLQLDKIMSSGKDGDKPIAAKIEQLEKQLRQAKRTKNPRRPESAATLTQWKAAIRSLMGLGPWTPAAAVKTVQATPHAQRGAFAQQLARHRNPAAGATSSAQYFIAAQIMRGQHPGDPGKAYDLIMATPAHDRSQWDRAAWRHRKEVYGPSGRRQTEDVPF